MSGPWTILCAREWRWRGARCALVNVRPCPNLVDYIVVAAGDVAADRPPASGQVMPPTPGTARTQVNTHKPAVRDAKHTP